MIVCRMVTIAVSRLSGGPTSRVYLAARAMTSCLVKTAATYWTATATIRYEVELEATAIARTIILKRFDYEYKYDYTVVRGMTSYFVK